MLIAELIESVQYPCRCFFADSKTCMWGRGAAGGWGWGGVRWGGGYMKTYPP
jgi:hypothetical protein